MSIISLTKRFTLTGLGALALATTAPSLPAHAQDYGGGGEVRVYAPRHVERDPYTGAQIDVARESRPVYYGDLDLNAAWGVRAFHDRVERAAVQLCSDLDWQRGIVPEDTNEDCIARAVRRAMYDAPIRDDLRYRVAEVGYEYVGEY